MMSHSLWLWSYWFFSLCGFFVVLSVKDASLGDCVAVCESKGGSDQWGKIFWSAGCFLIRLGWYEVVSKLCFLVPALFVLVWIWGAHIILVFRRMSIAFEDGWSLIRVMQFGGDRWSKDLWSAGYVCFEEGWRTKVFNFDDLLMSVLGVMVLFSCWLFFLKCFSWELNVSLESVCLSDTIPSVHLIEVVWEAS